MIFHAKFCESVLADAEPIEEDSDIQAAEDKTETKPNHVGGEQRAASLGQNGSGGPKWPGEPK